jgi:hypothetical protein
MMSRHNTIRYISEVLFPEFFVSLDNVHRSLERFRPQKNTGHFLLVFDLKHTKRIFPFGKNPT